MAIQRSKTCDYLAKILGFDKEEEIKASYLKDLNSLAETLKEIPESTRRLLLSFVEKSSDGTTVYVDEFNTGPNDYEGKRILHNVETLNRHKLVEFSKNNEGQEIIELSCNNYDFNYWGEIKKFCEIGKKSLEQIIVGLNFSIFDNE